MLSVARTCSVLLQRPTWPDHPSPDDIAVVYREDGDAPQQREIDVGRLFKRFGATNRDAHWFWTVQFQQRRGRSEPHQGTEPDLEKAKAAWKRCWESAALPIRWPPSLKRPGDAGNH